MNADNLEYLQNQLRYAGFGEGLFTELERKMKEGMPDFQLNASHEFGKDKMEAVLNFKKSDQEEKDMYFFNTYDATLLKEDASLSQTFFINNKGQSITFKEAANLLNGRSVFKELTPKEGAKYKAWVKLDMNERDNRGNAKLKQFNENYGFDPKEALGRIPIKELTDPDRLETIIISLQKGNLVEATLIKNEMENKIQLAADPQFKTLKMYDMDGAKLFMPGPKQDQRYEQAPADANRVQREPGDNLDAGDNSKKKELTQEPVAQQKRVDLLPKKVNDNNLLPKKAAGKRNGQAIA